MSIVYFIMYIQLILIKVYSNINVTWHLFTDSDLNIQSFPKKNFSSFSRQKGRFENVNKKNNHSFLQSKKWRWKHGPFVVFTVCTSYFYCWVINIGKEVMPTFVTFAQEERHLWGVFWRPFWPYRSPVIISLFTFVYTD